MKEKETPICIYKVVIFVCLFVCLIIPHAPIDQFASSILIRELGRTTGMF